MYWTLVSSIIAIFRRVPIFILAKYYKSEIIMHLRKTVCQCGCKEASAQPGSESWYVFQICLAVCSGVSAAPAVEVLFVLAEFVAASGAVRCFTGVARRLPAVRPGARGSDAPSTGSYILGSFVTISTCGSPGRVPVQGHSTWRGYGRMRRSLCISAQTCTTDCVHTSRFQPLRSCYQN